MTALAMDVRELTFDEIDFVSGGDSDQRENIRDGLIVAAICFAATQPAVWLAVGFVLLTATPAH